MSSVPVLHFKACASAGGDDFDNAIVEWLAEAHLPGVDWRAPAYLGNLRALAEAAKVRRSAPSAAGGHDTPSPNMNVSPPQVIRLGRVWYPTLVAHLSVWAACSLCHHQPRSCLGNPCTLAEVAKGVAARVPSFSAPWQIRQPLTTSAAMPKVQVFSMTTARKMRAHFCPPSWQVWLPEALQPCHNRMH